MTIADKLTRCTLTTLIALLVSRPGEAGEELTYRFETPHARLALLYKPPLSLPMESRLRLYYIARSGKSELRQLSDLRGKVAIRTEGEALEFVRLVTSPRTFRAFGEYSGSLTVELIPQSKVTSDVLFGDKRHLRLVRSQSNGLDGVVVTNSADLNRYFARAVRVKKGFEIYRTVISRSLTADGTDVKLYSIVESVGADGKYEIKSKRPVNDPKLKAYALRIDRLE